MLSADGVTADASRRLRHAALQAASRKVRTIADTFYALEEHQWRGRRHQMTNFVGEVTPSSLRCYCLVVPSLPSRV